jgi:hypothetical protein
MIQSASIAKFGLLLVLAVTIAGLTGCKVGESRCAPRCEPQSVAGPVRPTPPELARLALVAAYPNDYAEFELVRTNSETMPGHDGFMYIPRSHGWLVVFINRTNGQGTIVGGGLLPGGRLPGGYDPTRKSP